jgi:ribosomal-protein-alanine N-acetyltransferase
MPETEAHESTEPEPAEPHRSFRLALSHDDIVFLRRARKDDGVAFRRLVRESRELHRPWVSPPATPDSYESWLRGSRKDDRDSVVVCRIDDGALAGVFNLSEIVRGGFQSAYMGYYAFLPHAGQGLMSAGLQLVLAHAFTEVKLHRLEANVQPDNSQSTLLVQRAGLRREGYSSNYLKVAGKWCDHERWAITVEDWRAQLRRAAADKRRHLEGF